jgi:hypothetical protein
MNNATATNKTLYFTTQDLHDDGYSVVLEDVTFSYAGVVDGRVRSDRYKLGFSPAGRSARRTFGGPLIDDLFGFLIACPVVLDAYGTKTQQVPFELRDGDCIQVQGHGTFRVCPPTWLSHGPLVEVV